MITTLSLPLALAVAAFPASALTYQPAPRDANGRSNIADPDERGEALIERTRRSDRRAFAQPALGGMALVAPTGAAAQPPVTPFGLPR